MSQKTETLCDCPSEGGSPAYLEQCGEINDSGVRCTRPYGHEGQHSACSTTQHPVTAWGGE